MVVSFFCEIENFYLTFYDAYGIICTENEKEIITMKLTSEEIKLISKLLNGEIHRLEDLRSFAESYDMKKDVKNFTEIIEWVQSIDQKINPKGTK